jgi:ABC-type histidine transport system ATPase subunit
MKNYEVGSEWRRWDLHVHTPDSVLANEFKCNWDEYIQYIEDSGETVAVIGATDYASISGYKKLREAKSYGRMGNISEIFPNVELRITPETKNNKGINIHIIVDPSVANHIEEIEAALGRLNFKYAGQPYSCNQFGFQSLGRVIKGGGASQEECLKEGINQFKPLYETFFDWYNNESWLKKNSVIAAANGSNDGVSGVAHDHGLKAAKQNIYKQVQFIFSATPKDAIYFAGNGSDSKDRVIEQYGSLKPCIHGSDAHSLHKVFKPDEDRFCWIKAGPTFEGLKQVMFEPEQRVLIQSANPRNAYPRSYFSQITALGKIVDSELPKFKSTVTIPLNSNMVTLIGGRGTGKSILLDCIRKTFATDTTLAEPRVHDIKLNDFTIQLTKGDGDVVNFEINEEERYDYLHVKQSEIKDVAQDPKALSTSIKALLGIRDESSRQSYDIEVETLNKRLDNETKWFHQKDELGKLVNHKSHNEKIISANQALIGTITTHQNKEKIESYQKNGNEINKNLAARQKLEELKSKLVSYTLELRRDVQDFNTLGLPIPPIKEPDLSDVENSISDGSAGLSAVINKLTEENKKIAEEFRSQGIEQDVGGLLQKLELYQKDMVNAKSRIDMYDSKLASINTDIVARTRLINDFEKRLLERQEEIKKSFLDIKNGEKDWTPEQRGLVDRLLKDIDVHAEIDFDINAFAIEVSNLLNGQKLRSISGETKEEKILNKLGIKSFDDYLRLLKNEKMIDIGTNSPISITKFVNRQDQFNKNVVTSLSDLLFLDQHQKKYLTVKPVIRYLGKSPDRLSVGQRGTFYVCLKLATDPFGSPFIFDQPEDDLDNKFIMRELVPIFREIKKHRQVIIATHNANLVVNADAEQVIVAHNDDEIISYQAGSLENCSDSAIGIREQVCDILEGGQTAFEHRERKYGFAT